MTDSVDDRFDRSVEAFAREVAALLNSTVTTAASKIEILGADEGRTKKVVQILTDTGLRQVPMMVGGQPGAALLLRIGCRPDSTGRYVAVTKSDFAVYSTLDRTPLFRLEYRDDMRSDPSSHWQVHAERGALSNLLTLGGHNRPHELSALHLPTGGARMRPGIEDFIEFLVCELGIDAAEGWRRAIEESRAAWRRRQLRTMVRDVPEEAVSALSELGYRIQLPAGDAPSSRIETLTRW